VAKAVQDSHQSPGCDPIPGVTATPSGSLVTITGAQEIECDVTTEVRVGQPTDRFCSICSACCDRRIGTVAAARLDLDAALIQLDPGLKYKAEIVDVGPISGTQPVKVTGVSVRKRGSASDPPLTQGDILALDLDGHSSDPDAGLFSRHYKGAFSITPGKFSTEGDSGSAILSFATNDIMGLLFAGSDTVMLATPIDRILTAFDIGVETAVAAGVVKTVPAGEGMSIAQPDATPLFTKALPARLEQMHREIAATEAGAELIVAVGHHTDEARRLVSINRRIATVWNRSTCNGGWKRP